MSDTGRRPRFRFGADFFLPTSPRIISYDFRADRAGWSQDEWLLAEQEDLLIETAELPSVRPGQRADYLNELAQLEFRRERLRQLPFTAALALAFIVAVFWPQSDGHPPMPMHRNAALMAPPAVVRESIVGDHVANELLVALRDADSWAFVDAVCEFRDQRSHSLRSSFGSVPLVFANQ